VTGPATPIRGDTAPGFEPVRDAFAANFRSGDLGAACCVYRDGRPVVDLWAGRAEPGGDRAWEADTPVVVFSSTKGATAICIHRLAERGELDLEAPVAEYWPAFAAAGKAAIPVSAVLAHRAAVPVVDAAVSLDDVVGWHGVAAAVAAQRPVWPPGSAHGYHARTFGWILGELIRRITGNPVGAFFATEVADPLGLDFWIGLPADVEPRLAELVPPRLPTGPLAVAHAAARIPGLMPAGRLLTGHLPAPWLRTVAAALDPDSLLTRVMTGPSALFNYDQRWNTRPYHAAELPSSNGVASARAMARMYAATVGEVDGVRLLRPETVAAATVVRSDGTDLVTLQPSRFGAGFALPPMIGAAAPPGAFGHPGAGGSLGFADPVHHLGFGYAMNRMRLGRDGRAEGLVRAVYSCL